MASQDQEAAQEDIAACSANWFVSMHDQDAGFSALVNALEAAGVKQCPFASLNEAFQEDDDVKVMVFYSNPVTILAQTIEGDGPFEQHLEDWQERADALLALYRLHRHRMILMDGHAAITSPKMLLEWLQDHAGIEIDLSQSQHWQSSSEPKPIPWLIAKHVVRVSGRARRVAQELLASSLPVPESTEPSIQRLLSDWHSSDIEAAAKETQLLRLKLLELREEFEAFLQADAGFEEPSFPDDLVGSDGRLEQVRTELKWKEQTIQDMLSSKSWKLTAPLRKAMDLLTFRSTH